MKPKALLLICITFFVLSCSEHQERIINLDAEVQNVVTKITDDNGVLFEMTEIAKNHKNITVDELIAAYKATNASSYKDVLNSTSQLSSIAHAEVAHLFEVEAYSSILIPKAGPCTERYDRAVRTLLGKFGVCAAGAAASTVGAGLLVCSAVAAIDLARAEGDCGQCLRDTYPNASGG